MIYDLIIIGGDAAGLSAGLYAGRKKINAVILTKKIGGQSVFSKSIENYPGFLEVSGVELVSAIKKQVDKFGVLVKEGEEVVSVSKKDNIFEVKTKTGQYNAKSVLVATGRSWRALDVPGEQKFIGKGISACAICDGPFYSGKDVAIVGSGNSGLYSAQDLLSYANKIYVLEMKEKIRGDDVIVSALKNSGKVEFITSAKTKEIKGSMFVERLVYTDLISGEERELKVEGVFVNIGQAPNSVFVEDFLKLNEQKEIVIDSKTNSTSVTGVFAAGDVTDVKHKQFVVAAAEGAKALLSTAEYLGSGAI